MNSIFALKLDVLYSAKGRLRLRMHFKPTTLRDVHSIRGVQDVVYNERIGTLLIIYKADDIGEEELIMRIASGMAKQTDAEIIRIVREDGKAYSIPYSGALSLGCIITDALLTLSGSALSKYTALSAHDSGCDIRAWIFRAAGSRVFRPRGYEHSISAELCTKRRKSGSVCSGVDYNLWKTYDTKGQTDTRLCRS